MITNEQVEAALKAWYDAGDAGNFASMFAALKAADLASAARIAELEADCDRYHDAALETIAEMSARLRAENEKLRAALKPFADRVDDFIPEKHDAHRAFVTLGEIRAAAAALKETDNG